MRRAFTTIGVLSLLGLLTGLCQRGLREDSKGQHLLLGAKAILQPEILRTLGMDQYEPAVAVEKFELLLFGLSILDMRGGEIV